MQLEEIKNTIECALDNSDLEPGSVADLTAVGGLDELWDERGIAVTHGFDGRGTPEVMIVLR